MSYNLGPKLVDDTHKCELSNSDHVLHPEDLVGRDGFVYQPFEVRADLNIVLIKLRCSVAHCAKSQLLPFATV